MLRRDPAFNVTLGRTYLKALAERYDGADYLMAAAYNAGPMRVQRWIEERGDPRRMDRHARLDWLESIPFSETRNYVQRIVEGRRVYDWWLARGGGWKVPIRSPMGPLVPPPTPQAKPVLMAGTPRANGATADN